MQYPYCRIASSLLAKLEFNFNPVHYPAQVFNHPGVPALFGANLNFARMSRGVSASLSLMPDRRQDTLILPAFKRKQR